MIFNKYLVSFFLIILLVSPFSHAEAQSQSASAVADLLQKQIQLLLQQLQALQQQVITLQAQLTESPSSTTTVPVTTSTITEAETAPPEEPEFERVIARGATGDDVSTLQKFLSQDKEIYPAGLVTGYFGSLTELALRKFQRKHGIRQDGVLNIKTITKIQELRLQGAGKSGVIPPGLGTAPGIQKKFATSTTLIATSTQQNPTVPTSTTFITTSTATTATSTTNYNPVITTTSTSTPSTTTNIQTTTTASNLSYSSSLDLSNISTSSLFWKIWGPGSNGILLGGGLNLYTTTGVSWSQKYGSLFVTSYSIQKSYSEQYLTQNGSINVSVTGPTGSIIEVWDLESMTVVAKNATNPGSSVIFTAQPNRRYGGFGWYSDNSQKNIEIFASQTSSPITTQTSATQISGGSASGGGTNTSTSTADTIGPSIPGALTVSSTVIGSLTQATLSWTPSTDNVGVAGYKIYRNSALVTSYIPTSTIAGKINYVDNNLPAGTNYSYMVAAYDAAGYMSSPSNIFSITTPTPPIFSIASPNGGESFTVNNNYSITWTSGGGSVPNVNIELHKGGSFATTIAYEASNTGSYNWTVPSSLAVGTDYKVKIFNNMYYSSSDESDNTFSIAVPLSPPSASPVGFWKFDGNGNNDAPGATTSTSAIIVGSASFQSSGGKLGGYLYIPSSGDYAKIPHNNIFNLPDAFTIEFWFRQRSNQSFRQELIYKGSTSYYPYGSVNYWIWRQLWNEYNFGPIQASYINRDTNYYVGVTHTNQLAHNEWHHVVYTKDSTGSEYYLDGSLINRNTDSASAKTNSSDIIIGNSAPDTDIDNLRIYNQALSRGEVLYNYNSGSGVAGTNNFEKQLADIQSAFAKLQASLSKILGR